ncbi:MAG TPA: hypothetical protein VM536_05510 [Chloroflexia bacterium]|nr:hypothetical protein [Chloroflexia bacterium]
MDMTFANWHISVHREAQQRQQASKSGSDTRSSLERAAARNQQLNRVERSRIEAQQWFTIHGGR